MMDLFFADPEAVPLPPEDVRIREFRAEPWPDGKRVRITVIVDPFQQRPNLEVLIWNEAGQVVAEVTVVESVTRKIEFNMHLRQPEPGGTYRAQAVLFFQTFIQVEDGEPAPVEQPERLQVDCKESTFEITS